MHCAIKRTKPNVKLSSIILIKTFYTHMHKHSLCPHRLVTQSLNWNKFKYARTRENKVNFSFQCHWRKVNKTSFIALYTCKQCTEDKWRDHQQFQAKVVMPYARKKGIMLKMSATKFCSNNELIVSVSTGKY